MWGDICECAYKPQNSNVCFHWNVVKTTFELWAWSWALKEHSKMSPHPKWDRLYIYFCIDIYIWRAPIQYESTQINCRNILYIHHIHSLFDFSHFSSTNPPAHSLDLFRWLGTCLHLSGCWREEWHIGACVWKCVLACQLERGRAEYCVRMLYVYTVTYDMYIYVLDMYTSYICICTYMYIYVYICIYARLCVWACRYRYIYIYIYIYTHTYTHTYTCCIYMYMYIHLYVHICICVCVCVCLCVCLCVCVYIYVYIHIYTHTYTHIRTRFTCMCKYMSVQK